MNPALLIDGVDASATYGFTLATPQGWRDMPAIQRQTQNVPGRAGALLVGTPQEQSRQLKLTGTLVGADAADARTKLDLFLAALGYAGGVGLVFGDRPTVEYGVVLDSFSATASQAGALIARQYQVTLSVTLLRPYAEDLSATNVDITTADTALPLGTAPCLPTVTIIAGAALTNPTLTLKDSAGNTVGTLTLTLPLNAGDVLVIDCGAATISLNGADKIAALSAGDFLVLDPQAQANYALARWPTLAVSFTAGATFTCTAAYKRAWLS